jgi:hypothetical protein
MNQFNLTVGLRRIGITQPLGLSWLLGQDRRGGGAAEPGNRGTEARGRGDRGGGAGRAGLGRAEAEQCTEEAGRAEAARQQLNSLTGAAEKNGAWPPKTGRRRTAAAQRSNGVRRRRPARVGERGPVGRHAGDGGAAPRTSSRNEQRHRQWGLGFARSQKKKVGFARCSKKRVRSFDSSPRRSSGPL